MKKILLFWVTFSVSTINLVFANELLVLSGDNSQNSKRWQEEVLPGYEVSDLGKTLPAKIITIQKATFPDWFNEALANGRAGEIIGTPTFIIWDAENKKELGRVEGYTEKPKFYTQLNETLEMVTKGIAPNYREGSGSHPIEEGSGSNNRREGSSSSQDIKEHIYKTPKEAKRASKMLGFGGVIHSHETPNGTVYMPGATM